MLWSCPVRPINRYVRTDLIHVKGSQRNKGRPIKTWVEVIRKDMIVLNLTEDTAVN